MRRIRYSRCGQIWKKFAPHITPNSIWSPRLPQNCGEVCNRILNLVLQKFSHKAQQILKQPITLAKLTKAANALAKGKSLGPDGLTTDFCKPHRNFMGEDFTYMMNVLLLKGHFPLGVMRRLIALLFKEGNMLRLSNWTPIKLLNTTYIRCLLKPLCWLQPLLVEVIDYDQTTFLPLKYILDNIFLTYEIVEWSKESNKIQFS